MLVEELSASRIEQSTRIERETQPIYDQRLAPNSKFEEIVKRISFVCPTRRRSLFPNGDDNVRNPFFLSLFYTLSGRPTGVKSA